MGLIFADHVGTGPFSFVEWQEGQALILKKNPIYFEKDSETDFLIWMVYRYLFTIVVQQNFYFIDRRKLIL
jgi:ABC-type transport system substrate-binding protein